MKIKKNSERLPSFTVNYLELMDQCMENLKHKKSGNIGNPFVMVSSWMNQPQASRGVFKETRVPKYMAKRQMQQQRWNLNTS